MINILILLGESASGKSTIEKEIQKYGYRKIISYTTRDIRKGEKSDVDYHYISVEMFNSLKENGFFAECAVYNGWSYGTAKEDCTDDNVAVLTPHGMRQLKKVDGLNIKSFYINVPRRDRFIKILQRGDDVDEAIRRNLSDQGQYDGIKDEVDFVITNDGYKKTPEELAMEILRLANEIKSDK